MTGWRARLQALWYRPALSPKLFWLLPAEAVFALLGMLRRTAWRCGGWRPVRVDRPLVVVGNITVGGTGKTPLVAALVEQFRAAGRRPGIVARGYGGSGRVGAVDHASDAAEVGDEPLLLARRAGVPVFVGRDRVAAAQALLAAHPEVDLLVCDDGLQHYRLHRDFEIAVVDGRGFGNRHLLPAGPLREPERRLRRVDAVVGNGVPPLPPGLAVPRFTMRLVAERFANLADAAQRCAAADLRGRPLCAVAGIGDPARFFATLRGLGLTFEARAFADHHRYTAADFAFVGERVLLMTEKDAVKCRGLFAGEAWYLPVAARIEPDLAGCVLEKLHGHQTA